MLSKKTKYGLNAVLYLAERYNRGKVLIKDIAKNRKIPQKFLEAILLELNKKGFLHSKRGKGGGYSFKKHPREITFGEIIRVLEGPLAPVSCVSQTAYHRCEECLDEESCCIRLVMKEAREAISNILDKTSSEEMILKVKNLNETRTANYQI